MEMDWISGFASLIVALGGVEAVKYLANRRSNARIVGAKASAEEFHVLREYNEFLQTQLRAKDECCLEQSRRLQSANGDLLSLLREKAEVEMELALKRCEVKGCCNRKPQNGY